MHSDKAELNLIMNRTGRSLFLPGAFTPLFLADEQTQAEPSLGTECNERRHTGLHGYLPSTLGTPLFSATNTSERNGFMLTNF